MMTDKKPLDLDTIVKSISELDYIDLRALAESLVDILDDIGENGRPAKLNADHVVPALYRWSLSKAPLLTWHKGSDGWRARRGESSLTLYRYFERLEPAGSRFAQHGYMHGMASQNAPAYFDTEDEARAYAEVEFAEWLKKLGLVARESRA